MGAGDGSRTFVANDAEARVALGLVAACSNDDVLEQGKFKCQKTCTASMQESVYETPGEHQRCQIRSILVGN